MTTRSQMSSATLGFSVTSIFAELKHIFVEGPADLISRCAEDPMVALGYFLLFGWVVLRRHHRLVSPVSALTAYRTTTYQDEDIMDRSKESQSRPGSVQRNRIARKQEDAESTIPTGRLSPSLFPKEDRMDLSKQLQSRQESEHNKKLACKREDAENTILLDKMPEELLESSAQVEPIPSQSVEPTPSIFIANVKRKLPKSIEPSPSIFMEPSPSIFIANVERTLPKSIAHHKKLRFNSGLECGLELGDNRNYAKDETQMSVDLIKPFQDQALVWVPPPPPDPPNPP